jgi:hypothetical protein
MGGRGVAAGCRGAKRGGVEGALAVRVLISCGGGESAGARRIGILRHATRV